MNKQILIEFEEMWEKEPNKSFHGMILSIGEKVTSAAIEVSDYEFLQAMDRYRISRGLR